MNKNKVAIITGSSRGIGSSIAKELAKNGYNVVLNYKLNKSAAENVKKDIESLNKRAITIKADLTKISEIKNLIDKTIENFGEIDLLVNNAGYLEQKQFDKIDEENWDKTLDLNLKSVFFCSQYFSKFCNPNSSIINISSVGGQVGGPKAPHYSASKGGLITLTKSLARILSKQKIRVNAVSPGYIKTDMFYHILDVNNQNEKEIEDLILLGRVGDVKDVANAVIFLASDQASYITGHIINVNGGLLL